MATRPVSGAIRPASSAEQRGLARPVAADHADPLPGRHPERNAAEQLPCAYALTAFSRLIRFHAQVTSTGGTMTAPGTGPVTRTTERHTPAPDSDTARSSARSALTRGIRRSVPSPRPARPARPAQGPPPASYATRGTAPPRPAAGHCSAPGPPSLASPERSAVISAVSRLGPAGDAVAARPCPRPLGPRHAAGRARRTPRGWTAGRRRRPTPSGTGRRGQRGGQPLAPAAPHRSPAEQREGHVAADPGRHLDEVAAG